MSSDNFSEVQNGLIKDLIKNTQKAYDISVYKGKKDPHDKLKCLICGGSYSRQKKGTHCTTQKHVTAEKNIYRVINELFVKVE